MLKIDKDTMLKHLTPLAKIATAKRLPIFEFVHIRHRKDTKTMTLRCADENVFMTAIFLTDEANEENLDTCVSARLLLDMLKQLPSGEMSLELSDDECTLFIDWGTGRSHLYTTSWLDFPQETATGDNRLTLRLKQDDLLKAVKNVAGATADESYGRPALTSLCFDSAEGRVNIVASDSHQLICATLCALDPNPPTGKFLLSEKSAQALKGVLEGEDEVVLEFDEKHVRFSTDNYIMTSSLTCSKYPNYKSVIPQDSTGKATMDKEILTRTIKRMSVFASRESNTLNMNFSEGFVTVEGTDLSLGMSGKDILQCNYKGPELAVCVKITYLLNILNSLDSKILEVGVTAANRPLVIKPSAENETDEHAFAILMPAIRPKN